MSEITTQQ
jgi:hypothetical protein